MSKSNYIEIKGARVHNLKSIDVKIKHGEITVITGVSGSGKSSLINQTLLPISSFILNKSKLTKEIKCEKIEGLEFLDKVISIDQSPIGRTPRSNPATYTGLFSHIRDLLSQTVEGHNVNYQYSDVLHNNLASILAHFYTVSPLLLNVQVCPTLTLNY